MYLPLDTDKQEVLQREEWALGMRDRRPIHPPERFATTGRHQRGSQWATRKINYQRNDWRVRRAPLPSLLQMDIIKPLAGEWGLMTPSGPILGLNKRWKIKLRSKLHTACSHAVYQQCAGNQGNRKSPESCVAFCAILVFFIQ